MRQRLFNLLNQLATDRWARRGVRGLLRAAWLSVSIWCIGLGGSMLWGWPLRTSLLEAFALAAVGIGVALLLRPRLKPIQAARRLDQRFHLDEQLATAAEVAARNPPPGSIGARLVAEATQTATLLQRRIARRERPPWNDLLTLGLLMMVALGLWVMSGVSLPQLNPTSLPLPPLAEAQDPAQQLPAEPRAAQPGTASQPGATGPGSSQPGISDPQVLQALADALRDQGATRPAAAALDRGDIAGAARELRQLADQASQLSEATRNALADNLRQAADAIGPRNPALANQLEQSATGLERGAQRAAQALDDLARAIENATTTPAEANQPNGTQESSGESKNGAATPPPADSSDAPEQGGGGPSNDPSGAQRPANTSDRLGVEGQPVPLESAGAGEVPADSSGALPPSQGEQRPGFNPGGSNGSNQPVDVGDDPLRVPMDERDVVQEYFQP